MKTVFACGWCEADNCSQPERLANVANTEKHSEMYHLLHTQRKIYLAICVSLLSKQ